MTYYDRQCEHCSKYAQYQAKTKNDRVTLLCQIHRTKLRDELKTVVRLEVFATTGKELK